MLEVGAVVCWPRILEAGAKDRLLAEGREFGAADRLLAEGREFGAADRLHAEDRRNCRWCPKLLDASELDAWLVFWLFAGNLAMHELAANTCSTGQGSSGLALSPACRG
jgi:hypothetical protein